MVDRENVKDVEEVEVTEVKHKEQGEEKKRGKGEFEEDERTFYAFLS